jgi:DNA-binding NtrC family response regulator
MRTMEHIGWRVLLVDQELSLLARLAIAFAGAGVEVVTVVDAATAVVVMEGLTPFQVVIAGAELRGARDGVELLEWVHATFPTVVRFLLTPVDESVVADPDGLEGVFARDARADVIVSAVEALRQRRDRAR